MNNRFFAFLADFGLYIVVVSLMAYVAYTAYGVNIMPHAPLLLLFGAAGSAVLNLR